MGFLKNITDSAGDDQELVARYKQTADTRVLSGLYLRYIDLVYGVCLKYLGDSETAKDAVMTVFEELIPKLKKHEVTHFKGWLFTLVKNHCLMHLRTVSRMRIVDFDGDRMQSADDAHLGEVLQQEERHGQLTECLQGLAPAQKESVELFYFQKKCYRDIATITGHDPEKVRSLIQNGRRNLKICMEKKTVTLAHE